MPKPPAFDTGEAIIGRIYGDPDRSWTNCLELADHPTSKLTRAELVEVAAYLAAQVVGLRDSVDRNAALAMTQVQSIVNEYATRTGGAA